MGKLSAEERLNAAIGFEHTDRIPCAPLIENYAARFAGISYHDYYYNSDKGFAAFAVLKERYPIWDIRRSFYVGSYGPSLNKIGSVKSKMPGVDLPENYDRQVYEVEVMSRQDYKLIVRKGYKAYTDEYCRRAHGASDEDILQGYATKLQVHLDEIKEAEKEGQAYLYGASLVFAADRLSLARSFTEFIRDMYQIPERLIEAIALTNEAQIQENKELVKKTGISRVMIGLARMGGQFFSLPVFEKFIWPFLKKMIVEFIEAGITPVLHLDTDWGLTLPYFLEVPKKKMILELDGSTDIFLAKKTLDGHSCLLGDVPSTLFTVGTAEKVSQYCRRLLEEVGAGGGFILSSGCSLPSEAEHSNVEAFFHSL